MGPTRYQQGRLKLSGNSPRSPPFRPELSGIGRFVLKLRLAWIGWRVDRLKTAHGRLAAKELALSKKLKK